MECQQSLCELGQPPGVTVRSSGGSKFGVGLCLPLALIPSPHVANEVRISDLLWASHLLSTPSPSVNQSGLCMHMMEAQLKLS